MIAFSFSETFPFRIDIIIHHKERKINRFLVILSNIGALHKLEYLFLWKYFKKQVVFCRKRFLCCATVSICCAVFTANRTTIRLYFSRLYPPVGGRDSPLPGCLPPLRDSFFCGVVGAASMRPARSPFPPIPRETAGGIYAAPTKRQRTVSTACCLIYLLYTLSQVFVDSRILTW